MSSNKVDFWTTWANADWTKDIPHDDGTIKRTSWIARLCGCGRKPLSGVSWKLHELFVSNIEQFFKDPKEPVARVHKVKAAIEKYNELSPLKLTWGTIDQTMRLCFADSTVDMATLVQAVKKSNDYYWVKDFEEHIFRGVVRDAYAEESTRGVYEKLPGLVARYNTVVKKIGIDTKIRADDLTHDLSNAKNGVALAFTDAKPTKEQFETIILDAHEKVRSYNLLARALKEKPVDFTSFVIQNGEKSAVTRAMRQYNAVVKKHPELKIATITARGLGLTKPRAGK